MSFVVYAWLASFFYGLVSVFGKLTSKYAIKNIWLFNFLYALFTLLFTIPLALNNHIGIPSHWGNLTLSALFNTLFIIFYILAIFNLDVSVIRPLFNFRTAFGAILSYLLLQEVLNPNQVLLILTIFFAGIFVAFDEKFSLKSFFHYSILYGVLMSLFLALDSIYINKAIAETSLWETNLYNPLITIIFLLFTFPLFYKDLIRINLMQVAGVASMALAVAIANILANHAYSENVSISTAIIALPLSLFIVFALSFFAPRLLEKHTLKVYAIRFAAAAVMIISALKLSL